MLWCIQKLNRVALEVVRLDATQLAVWRFTRFLNLDLLNLSWH